MLAKPTTPVLAAALALAEILCAKRSGIACLAERSEVEAKFR